MLMKAQNAERLTSCAVSFPASGARGAGVSRIGPGQLLKRTAHGRRLIPAYQGAFEPQDLVRLIQGARQGPYRSRQVSRAHRRVALRQGPIRGIGCLRLGEESTVVL